MHFDLLRRRDVKAFPAGDDAAAVTSVKVWDCSFPSSPVRQFENLQGLEILSLRDASLEFLAGLVKLRYLLVIHLPKVSNEAIAALPSLRHLELFSVVPKDRSLAPLEVCRSLVTARFQGFPKREVARFEAVTGLPNDAAPSPSGSSF